MLLNINYQLRIDSFLFIVCVYEIGFCLKCINVNILLYAIQKKVHYFSSFFLILIL